jgi:predicted TPR repeat methyltransferase
MADTPPTDAPAAAAGPAAAGAETVDHERQHQQDHDPNGPGIHQKVVTLDEAMALAVGLLKDGNFESAEKIYQRVLEVAPDHVDALHFMGVVLHRRKRPQEAIASIQRALELAPNYVDALNNLGNILAEEGKLAEAEAAYHAVLQLRPEHPPAYANLGTVMHKRGDLSGAEAAYRKALELDPKHWEAYHQLGGLLLDMKQDEDGLTAFGKALQLHRYDESSYRNLGFGFYVHGRLEAAVAVYRRWLELQPDSALARHYLAACSGEKVPARAEDEYVQRTFDLFAGSFDEVLAGLAYRAPALTAEAVAAAVGAPGGSLDVLDAGAGTGLCGPLLRPFARRLTGVDLSPKMLEKAKERGVYDALDEAELTTYIAARPGAFDLIVSADTLVYFGDLGPVIAAAAAALRPGGHLVFTVEHAREAPPPGYRINPHGRYSHSEPYVRGALTAAGLTPLALTEVVPRNEKKQPVDGLLVTARR